MPFITGIKFDAEKAELIVTSQDFKAEGESIVPAGESSESRVRLATHAVSFALRWSGDLFSIMVTNKGLVPIYGSRVTVVIPGNGGPTMSVNFKLVGDPQPFLTGSTEQWSIPLHQPHFMLDKPIMDFLRTSRGDSYHIVCMSGDKEVGRVEGTELQYWFNKRVG